MFYLYSAGFRAPLRNLTFDQVRYAVTVFRRRGIPLRVGWRSRPAGPRAVTLSTSVERR